MSPAAKMTPTDVGAFLSNGHNAGDAAAAASVPWADGRALYQRPVRRVAHLVDGLIPAAGLVLVTGEDKAGKTTVVGLLGLCYIYALPFLGRSVPQAGSVIIVSEEDDGDELRDRMRAEHQALAVAYSDRVRPPDDPASLALVAERLIWEAREGVRLDDPTMITSLVAQIALLRAREPDGPPVLVLIDSLQAVRGLLDPTKPEGIAVLKVVLRQLTAAGAVVVLIATHGRSPPAGSGPAAPARKSRPATSSRPRRPPPSG
jgi:KaiC/GvpD/RAD55 family RecA-like ATPase